ncbi:MAG: hypothetical protein SFW67_32495 [Myxococcaceae bacterium]|nr:hypothetical protein [Myxococcaceae bacterium]
MSDAIAPGGPVFVTGSTFALRCLRRALATRCRWFVSHLPIEGEACVELLERSRVPGVWLSEWAVSHAAQVSARLSQACFVVVEDDDVRGEAAAAGPCLRLSARRLAADPSGEIERLWAFIDGACARAA